MLNEPFHALISLRTASATQVIGYDEKPKSSVRSLSEWRGLGESWRGTFSVEFMKYTRDRKSVV